MLNINKDYLKSHKCGVNKNTPTFLVVHETDNPEEGADAIRHGLAHINGNLGDASVHFFVDQSNIIQTLKYEDAAWHVGIRYGSPKVPQCNNYNSIGIEMCVNKGNDYDKTWYNTIDLVRYLMKELNIPANRVITHYEACVKWCPRITLNNDWWTNFKDYINNPSKFTPTSPQSTNIDIPSDFNFYEYLKKNDDVMKCILNGGFNSGINGQVVENACKCHFLEHGRNEGRIYK